jgi:hypothetical protein
MTKLFYYGENSFTFLLFQALSADDLIQRILIPNLRRITDGKAFGGLYSLPNDEPQVCLFPCFGKSKGFGEPDALVVVGDHMFWFEVETHVDTKRGGCSFEQALLQMFRFHLLASAISQGAHADGPTSRPYLAISGVTLGDKLKPRKAKVRRTGHRVLANLGRQISRSIAAGTDHYVLLLDRKPRGITNAVIPERLRNTLAEYHHTLTTWCKEENISKPSVKPSEERFWRLYWRGGLSRHFKKEGLGDPFSDGQRVVYLPIVSSQRR